MNTQVTATIEPIPDFTTNPEVSGLMQQNDIGKQKIEAAFQGIANGFKQVSEKMRNLEIENQKLRAEIANVKAQNTQILNIHHDLPLHFSHEKVWSARNKEILYSASPSFLHFQNVENRVKK